MRITAATARTIVLSGWAALFVALWVLDEGLRYLGPRTQWVIPFGAITLTVAAVAHGGLALVRRRDARPLPRGELAGSVALFVPMLALLLVPQPSLGAQAASNRRASAEVLKAQISKDGPAAIDEEGILDASFVQVAAVSLNPIEGFATGIQPGARVRVLGFTVHDDLVPKTFLVARFLLSCCAADALPVVIPVDGGSTEPPPEDQWLIVTGKLQPRAGKLVIVAERMEPVGEPSSPYVS